MNKNVIAIDGYASTGKSTLAKRLAKRLECLYMDTGYMFRVLAYLGLKKGFISADNIDEVALLDAVASARFSWVEGAEGTQMAFDGTIFGDEIRGTQVSNQVSKVATLRGVRTYLLAQQRLLAQDQKVIMDGRDIGTVVFPDAQYKFFMTAAAEIRAKRRHQELLSKGMDSDFAAVLHNVIARDEQDTQREIAPLRKAEDAVEINTGDLSVAEVEELMLGYLMQEEAGE